MKKLIRWLFLIVILFSVSSTVLGQIYVKIRPAAPVIVRSAQPSREHVWIDEEWEPNGASYKYSEAIGKPHPTLVTPGGQVIGDVLAVVVKYGFMVAGGEDKEIESHLMQTKELFAVA